MLVVDEVGYLAHDPDAANVLFHVVNERHLKKRAMVFTTNKELSVWGQVLHDNDLGEAIVDRILERGRLIRLDGPSVRSRHLDPSNLSPLKAESPAPEPHPNRPEFPEPTERKLLTAIYSVAKNRRPFEPIVLGREVTPTSA